MASMLAIDPGCEKSGYVWLEDGKIDDKGILQNCALRYKLYGEWVPDAMAIEMVASYGMAVGEDVFETVFWIGRLWDRAGESGVVCQKVYRKDVKMYLCGSMRAKDANIVTAIVDRYDPQRKYGKYGKGTKTNPGPLFGFTSHMWSALAVGLYATRGRDDSR